MKVAPPALAYSTAPKSSATVKSFDPLRGGDRSQGLAYGTTVSMRPSVTSKTLDGSG